MRIKARLLTVLLFGRKDPQDKEDDDQKSEEDFDTFAAKYMQDSDKNFRTQCVQHSLPFFSPETIRSLLESSNSENLSDIRRYIEQMLTVTKDISPGEKFHIDQWGFKDDLHAL